MVKIEAINLNGGISIVKRSDNIKPCSFKAKRHTAAATK